MRTVFPSLIRWFQGLSSTRRTLLTILGLCSGLLILSWAFRTSDQPAGSPGPGKHSTAPKIQAIDAELKDQWNRLRENSKRIPPMPSLAASGGSGAAVDLAGASETPLIAHAADLEVTTKEFARSRSSLEEILERHHGYASKLRMIGQPAGSLLTATLRVPSSEFSAAVADLKALGNVEREEQTADEITQQRADLEARLTNAQSSLARLQGILAKGDKFDNLGDVRRQLANVNGEIARLEAERIAAEHRVIFAQVLFSLREVVTPPTESLTTQFRNAAVTGLSDLLNNLSAIAIFAISRGPVILLWVLVLYFPFRWAWRKCRLAMAPETGAGQ
jgi:Domain of unknown function (DUF4349)